MEKLIGKTGYSFLDVWTIVHFAFWVFAASVLWGAKVRYGYALSASLLFAYAWECFERYAERRWPQYWLHSESWWNSWLSDPLMCVLGFAMIWAMLDRWGK